MKSGDLIKQVLGLEPNASDETTALALRRALFEPEPQTTVAVDDAQADFARLATLYSKTHRVSLSEAYSRVSQECPILYERASAQARLN